LLQVKYHELTSFVQLLLLVGEDSFDLFCWVKSSELEIWSLQISSFQRNSTL
jgi:hypothetical protein